MKNEDLYQTQRWWKHFGSSESIVNEDTGVTDVSQWIQVILTFYMLPTYKEEELPTDLMEVDRK